MSSVRVKRYDRAELIAEREALLDDLRTLDALMDKYWSRDGLVDEIRRCDFLLGVDNYKYYEPTDGPGYDE